MRFTLPRERRLRTSSDFQNVRRKGRSLANGMIALWVAPSGLEQSRVGFSVGRRVGKAVTRNRVKRRLREIIRLRALRPGVDVVLTARKPAAGATYQELEAAVADLLRKANVESKRNTPGADGA